MKILYKLKNTKNACQTNSFLQQIPKGPLVVDYRVSVPGKTINLGVPTKGLGFRV